MSQLVLVDEERLKELEMLVAERDYYARVFMTFCRLTDKLKDAFLGSDYYITDPVGEPQASEIIIDEVIRKYAPRKHEKPTKKRIFNRFGQR